MEVLLGFLLIGIFFAPLIAVLVFRKKLKSLEEKYRLLEGRLSRLEEEPAPEPAPSEYEEIRESSTALRDSLPDHIQSEESEPSGNPGNFRWPPFLKKLEKQFLDNWTGILGAAIIVLGAGFLSLYAALRMKEFARFLLLLLLAALPAGLFFFLKGREGWRRQASWFRSISGAVFLFACLGSGGIPGLQWIHNPFQSLGLLTLGIVVNLGLSSLGGKQYFASFHTLLSLLALAVIPPGTTSLFMAAVICLYGIIQTYRIRWDLHLLLTITGFFAYHLYWMTALQSRGFTDLVRYQGAGAVILIFFAAAFIHYRKSYATGKFEVFPFLVHLANWFYFIAGMILYTGESPWRTLPLAAAAVVALLLAGLADKKGIHWLKITDYLIMQVLIVSAFLTLQGWDVRSHMIAGLVFAEALLLSRVMILQGLPLLFRVGVNLSYIGGAALMGMSIASSGSEFSAAVLPAGALLLTLVNHRSMSRHKNPRWLKEDTLPGLGKMKKEFSLSGLMAGLLGWSAFGALHELDVPPGAVFPIGALLLIALLWERKQSPSRGLTAGSVLFLAGFVFSGWADLLSTQSAWLHTSTGLSLAAVTGWAVLALQGAGKKLKGATFAWLLATGSILLFSFALLQPLSPLLPGIAWLLLAAGAAAAKGIPPEVRRMGLIPAGAFLVRHFTVHIFIEESWAFLPQRYVMAVLVLPVLLLWYRQRRKESPQQLGRWLPLLLETILVFVLSVLMVELSLTWIPFALECLAVLILVAGSVKPENSRLRLYSLFVNWIALLLLAAGVLMKPADPVFPLGGALAMIAGLGYLVLSYRFAAFREITAPDLLKGLRKAAQAMDRGFNAFILYPLVLGCAFFILDAAPRETRTFFWALECFLIYGASLFLRQEHFRSVSQGGLALCVIRLLLIDMSGSTVLIRGLVFLGVGVMMLGVNVLYNRYKGRFLREPADWEGP